MSSTLTTPKANVPIGRLMPNGIDVEQNPEFVRFFFDLVRRTGGVTAPTNIDLEVLSEKLSAINPPSEVLAQAAERLAEDLHAQIASLRGSLDDAMQRVAEISAQLQELPRVPDLSARVSQIEDRLA